MAYLLVHPIPPSLFFNCTLGLGLGLARKEEGGCIEKMAKNVRFLLCDLCYNTQHRPLTVFKPAALI